MAAHGHYANLYCNYGPCVHTIPCTTLQNKIKFEQSHGDAFPNSELSHTKYQEDEQG